MGSSYYLEEQFYFAQEEGKEIVSKLICPVHNKKAKVSFDYDNFGNNAYIKKACCSNFLKQVKKVLSETQSFNKIEIEDTALK